MMGAQANPQTEGFTFVIRDSYDTHDICEVYFEATEEDLRHEDTLHTKLSGLTNKALAENGCGSVEISNDDLDAMVNASTEAENGKIMLRLPPHISCPKD